jgi:DNA-binding beta-propeller fold protein YncE
MNLQRPWGIAVRKDGKRYIRDAHYGQAVLQKANGSYVGLVGSVHYHFEGSYDIAIDSKGRLVSAKWGDGYDPKPGFRVQDEKLNLVVDYRQPEGREPGQVRQPMGVGIDSRDHIFIADTGNDRVQEFTPDGKFVQIIGAGEVYQPMKVAFDKQDRMYVADSGKNRIGVYERATDGKFKLVKSLLGGIKEPCYVAVDPRGRIFVSTNRVAGVYMFAGLDGPENPTWSYKGTDDDPLSGPRGLAFDGQGNLLIVDESTRKVRTVKLP